ncbi:hypothetical protein BOTNAR_0240g00100 [Botryotinia narcissicola]|uniref:Uncharacterized protein n=1 Tax=Botryotinia narcissicola TaxID=278944 RepID=A0A4Z1IFT5_9HELO|nr:hypothetical protein BOTNAR_0240g00100 [Botryotinia narcissicola]
MLDVETEEQTSIAGESVEKNSRFKESNVEDCLSDQQVGIVKAVKTSISFRVQSFHWERMGLETETRVMPFYHMNGNSSSRSLPIELLVDDAVASIGTDA